MCFPADPVNKPLLKGASCAVGLIAEPEHAEAIVGTGDADVIALARAILYDPRWPWHAAAGLDAQVTAPDQYLRSQPRRFRDFPLVDPHCRNSTSISDLSRSVL